MKKNHIEFYTWCNFSAVCESMQFLFFGRLIPMLMMWRWLILEIITVSLEQQVCQCHPNLKNIALQKMEQSHIHIKPCGIKIQFLSENCHFYFKNYTLVANPLQKEQRKSGWLFQNFRLQPGALLVLGVQLSKVITLTLSMSSFNMHNFHYWKLMIAILCALSIIICM